MSTTSPVERSEMNGIRTAFGLGGILLIVLGVLILVWPGKTAAVVTAIFAIYAIAAGLVYIGLGIFSILAVIAAAVYIVDVKPAVKGMGRGGNNGPYGPW